MRISMMVIADVLNVGEAIIGEIKKCEEDGQYRFFAVENGGIGEITTKFIYEKLKELNNA